jgi:hypothetical protein
MPLLIKLFSDMVLQSRFLTDQGTQFKPARGETSAFDIHCRKLGIEHVTASVRRPTTCGKKNLIIIST